jgi:hypothetical protein
MLQLARELSSSPRTLRVIRRRYCGLVERARRLRVVGVASQMLVPSLVGPEPRLKSPHAAGGQGDDVMSEEGKYIIFQDGSARLFEKHHVHAWMSGGLSVTSAGYYRIVNGDVECFGGSETLDVKSCPGDGDILRRLIGMR